MAHLISREMNQDTTHAFLWGVVRNYKQISLDVSSSSHLILLFCPKYSFLWNIADIAKHEQDGDSVDPNLAQSIPLNLILI